MKINFDEMQDVARQIENIAFLLRAAAESGQLFDAGDPDTVEYTAKIVQEKAWKLGAMIQSAKDAAAE